VAQGFAIYLIIVFAVLYSGVKSRCLVHFSCQTLFSDLDMTTENVALTYLISAWYWLGRCADDTYSKFRGDSDIVCLLVAVVARGTERSSAEHPAGSSILFVSGKKNKIADSSIPAHSASRSTHSGTAAPSRITSVLVTSSADNEA
jgi:hypothetical protein